MSSRAAVLLSVVLLLGYFAARIAALDAFPPFVDEAFHVNFGRLVLESGPLARSEEGRQFVIWLYVLFGAPVNAPLWMARAANLIVLLPGFAAAIETARLLSNRWGGLLAGLLIVFSPYHHFFERLALADPISASAVVLAIYFAARLKHRTSLTDAALCGIALFAAVGAKISALPYFVIPVIAVLALRRSRVGIRWGVAALGVGGLLTGAYLGILFWRGYNPLFYVQEARTEPLTQVVPGNIVETVHILIGYFGLPAAILLAAAAFVVVIRRRFFLPLCLILPLLVLWLSPRQDSRHLIAPMTLLLLGAGVALGRLIEWRRPLRAPVIAAVTVWGAALWLPFALTEATDPARLALPASDRAEYITSESAGFGLAQVIAALETHHPKRVIGILANCLSLRDMAPFPVECPRVSPNGEDVPALSDLLAASRADGTYAVLETLAYAPQNSPGTLVNVIEAERPRLSIYDLAP
ncbi:MAG: hypothetical protein IT319_04835 [Anaerolineae bacterium]|nr:hypothetical protein [Anaerolineae bacterium]